MNKVYVDLHNCILTADDRVNHDMVELVNSLFKSYDIVVWTAGVMTRKELEDELPDNLKYNDLAVCPSKSGDDVERKLSIIQDVNNIAFVIDNNKHVYKALAKKGINTLRYRIG